LNVLIAVPWDQDRGGVAWVVGTLARYCEQRGHSVILLHPGSERLRSRKTVWGFRGYTLNMRGPLVPEHPVRSVLTFVLFVPLTLLVLCQLAILIRKHSIDIVNVQYPGPMYLHFALCRLLLPVKLVVSVHGSDLFPVGKPPRRYALSLRFLLTLADLIVAPSQAFARRVASAFPRLGDRLIWIHNGIELSDWTPPAKQPDSPGLNGAYVLCVAMHLEVKRIDVLLRAFVGIHAVNHDIRLVLVGDGPLRKDLERLADSLGIRDRIDFVGCCRNQPVLRRLLHGCTVFALPSSSESFSLATLEAMACGKPVVASRVGGIPELIEHGRNGILVEPGDPSALCAAISQLLANDELRRRLGNNARMTASERFTAGRMAARYEAEFVRLTAEPGGLPVRT
jgi:glycosyltransferase involved in cell wall biosynthesis